MVLFLVFRHRFILINLFIKLLTPCQLVLWIIKWNVHIVRALVQQNKLQNIEVRNHNGILNQILGALGVSIPLHILNFPHVTPINNTFITCTESTTLITNLQQINTVPILPNISMEASFCHKKYEYRLWYVEYILFNWKEQFPSNIYMLNLIFPSIIVWYFFQGLIILFNQENR